MLFNVYSYFQEYWDDYKTLKSLLIELKEVQVEVELL
jgi:hypothetical protein